MSNPQYETPQKFGTTVNKIEYKQIAHIHEAARVALQGLLANPDTHNMSPEEIVEEAHLFGILQYMEGQKLAEHIANKTLDSYVENLKNKIS